LAGAFFAAAFFAGAFFAAAFFAGAFFAAAFFAGVAFFRATVRRAGAAFFAGFAAELERPTTLRAAAPALLTRDRLSVVAMSGAPPSG
jgi:hypothetical protein